MKTALVPTLLIAPVVGISVGASSDGTTDALPSWRDTAAKSSIVEFVAAVTDPKSPDFVPPSERIAVFDNDGTLWSEQRMHFQLAFAIDEVKRLAPEHPEWKTEEPFASLLKGDLGTALAGGTHAILEIVLATHAGNTSEEFARSVESWLETARHPTKGRRYDELVFQPMLELLAHLRENGFRTYIVSGGGIEFMRVFAEDAYGIPPEQVIGSSIRTKYEVQDGKPVITRLPEMEFIDDGPGKPVGIHKFIGRRPIAAFGNSDGDLEMLRWTMAGPGRRFALYVHHTDAEREWAYDRESKIGHLDAGLDAAKAGGWTIVDMKSDWETIHPPASGD